MPCDIYGKPKMVQVCEVTGKCPLLISEESMSALGVTMRLSERKMDLTKLDCDQELRYHDRSGHLVSLLPTTRHGATKTNVPIIAYAENGEDGAVEPVTIESGWDLLRKADRRRALAYICREQPDLLVAAWPCRYFS